MCLCEVKFRYYNKSAKHEFKHLYEEWITRIQDVFNESPLVKVKQYFIF